MVRKFVLMLATAAAVGGAAFIPAAASAGEYGYSGSVRSDVRDIHRDRADLRRDKRDLHRDLATGRYGAARHELADIHRDRRDLHSDRRDLRHDRYRRGY
jgi:hypothetical protein